ncbi:hypothetical protein [Fenollaria sporofastidiosus]|uniref:hypothetical protein n=1 Tax=Fenollaria sporofastidiosus TaxID=2811778 RepID=UPI001C00802C|nr:hypothetical protein [Fenollaria sporofastidiosus]
MNEFFKSHMWPVITLLIGGVFQFLLTLATDKIKDKKDKENERRKCLKKSYDYILKYLNKIPITTTKDVLNSMRDSTRYDGLETSDIIYKMYSDLEKYDSNKEKHVDEIKELEDNIDLLKYNERMYREACDIAEEFKSKEYEVFNLYASREVKMAWSLLKVIVDSGYKRDSKGEYKAFIIETDDINFDNKFVDAYEKLYSAIRKDLDIKIDNDIITKN